MKLTPQDKQEDFLRYFTILIITAYLIAIFGKWAFIAFGVFAFVFFAAWAYLSFLNPESIIERRDNFEEPPFDSAYDEWKQTGVDRRNYSKKSNSSDNPGQLYSTTGKEKQPGYGTKVCQPCAFTGVVTDAERNAFDWPEFTTPKNK